MIRRADGMAPIVASGADWEALPLRGLLRRHTKAQSATFRRVSERYAPSVASLEQLTLEAEGMRIHVETTATVLGAVQRIRSSAAQVYVAMTNGDGVAAALVAVKDSSVGVMDAWGNIVRPSQSQQAATMAR